MEANKKVVVFFTKSCGPALETPHPDYGAQHPKLPLIFFFLRRSLPVLQR